MLDFLENYVFNIEKSYTIFLIGNILLSLILMFYSIKKKIRGGDYNDKDFLACVLIAILGFIPIANSLFLFIALIFFLYILISVLFEHIIEKINNKDKNDNRDKI